MARKIQVPDWVSRMVLLQERLLEWPVCNFSKKFLVRRHTALPGCTKEDYLLIELQYLNSASHGGNHLVIMQTRPLLHSDSDGFIKLHLSVLSSLTPKSPQYRRFFSDKLALCWSDLFLPFLPPSSASLSPPTFFLFPWSVSDSSAWLPPTLPGNPSSLHTHTLFP